MAALEDEITVQPASAISAQPAYAVTPGVSPWVFSSGVKGAIISSGGTVSAIEYGRNGAYTTIGTTAGMFEMSAQDTVRITYTVAPTVNFLPR